MSAQNLYENRLEDVLQAVESAALGVGRSPTDVTLIGVTKTIEASAIDDLLDAGIREFGENRWQHARELLVHSRAREATWHFIGHLQSNKIKYIVPNFSVIHSIDSIELATEIENFASKHDIKIRGLLQVNVSGEQSKFGVAPESALSIVRAAKEFECLQLVGLMTMAPQDASADEVRVFFRSLRELCEQIASQTGLSHFKELSMGMSNDFTIAVEEGATMIRVGRRLMGGIEK